MHMETITPKNVLRVFEEYEVSKRIGVLSIMLRSADYWVLSEILTKYAPKIVVHQVNPKGPTKCVTVPKKDAMAAWDGSDFYGASVCAYQCLAKEFKYTMLYCESSGSTCFWVRNDLIQEYMRSNPEFIRAILVPETLYQRPIRSLPKSKNKWHQVKCKK